MSFVNENLTNQGCKRLINAVIYLGPASVNRFTEVDDELDVDVEQCSDSEALSRSRTPRTNSNNSRGTTPSPSDDERLTPEPVIKICR
jgi:hypothetical protein